MTLTFNEPFITTPDNLLLQFSIRNRSSRVQTRNWTWKNMQCYWSHTGSKSCTLDELKVFACVLYVEATRWITVLWNCIDYSAVRRKSLFSHMNDQNKSIRINLCPLNFRTRRVPLRFHANSFLFSQIFWRTMPQWKLPRGSVITTSLKKMETNAIQSSSSIINYFLGKMSEPARKRSARRILVSTAGY